MEEKNRELVDIIIAKLMTLKGVNVNLKNLESDEVIHRALMLYMNELDEYIERKAEMKKLEKEMGFFRNEID